MSKPRHKTYSEYKESGEEWLGRVPAGWDVIPIKRLSIVKRGASPRPIDDAKYFAENGEYAWTRITDVTASDVYLKEAPQRLSYLGSSLSVKLEPGSLFLSIAGTVGKPCITSIKACIHDGFVYFPELKTPPKFLYYIFAGEQAYKGLGKFGTQLNLNTDTVGGIKIGCPSVPEQIQIAKFLDHETAKIDRLIEKQEALIALLKEKRQAVISHAVTKGLNPDAPLKDSGIEWLGQVPAHWVTTSVKFCARSGHKTFIDGDWVEAPFITDNGVRLLQTGNVGIGTFKEQGFRYISHSSFKSLGCTEVDPGDVLICRLDGPVGRACLAPVLESKMITSVDNAILKPSPKHDAAFLVYALSSNEWLEWTENLCRAGGGFRFRISRSMLGDQRVPIPPIAEQIQIRKHLDRSAFQFGNLVDKATTQITLLRERRTALISAAVTGKIDVRSWQPPELDVT